MIAALMAFPVQAQDKGQSAAVKAMSDYCIAAIKNNEDPAAFAQSQKLPELPQDQAIKFSPDGGHVFAIPAALGNAVLMTSKTYQGACSIAVRETNTENFWKLVDNDLQKKFALKLMREKRQEDQKVTKREYKGDLGGPITFLVTASDTPRPSGIQALMTAARVAP